MNTEYPSEKAKNLVTQYGSPDRCIGKTISGERCPMRAIKDRLCFSHAQIARDAQGDPDAGGIHAKPKLRPMHQAWIFALSPREVADRIERLTVKQMTALEYLCDGETYKSMSAVLGVTDGAIVNWLTFAARRAGVRTRVELIALYAMWRVLKGGAYQGNG